jgi:hypothetical protein
MTDDRWMKWLEVISLVVIVGSVAAIAVPKTGEMQRARTAQQLLGDVETVRKAVYRFYSDSAYFPEPVAGRQVPDGLRPYLPGGFELRRPYGSFDYRQWPMGVPDTAVTRAPHVVGVTVTVHDPRIGAAAAARAHDLLRFTIGNKYTFLFFGS